MKLRSDGYYYSPEDAKLILEKAAQLGLLLGTGYNTAKFQKSLKASMKKMERVKLLSNLYYLFIPVLNPDKFLEKVIKAAPKISFKWILLFFAPISVGALYLLLLGFPRIRLEYLFFFNLQNLICLWLTIAITKLVHEFAHALTAKYYGLHVPEMGIAFLIFFPCLYCNTTDAWQLADRRQRASISAAGIIAEAALATIAIYFWYFTQPGMLNSLTFYLMAVSFGSTLLFNGNPLLKFDGYFILIDYLNMPNLAPNALKHVKHLFMNRVLGHPKFRSPAQDRREAIIYTIYGVSAFCYRIFISFSISLGVYNRFDKVLGVVLMLIAMSLFMARPLYLGSKSLFLKRRDLRPQPAGVAVLSMVLALLITSVIVPWSSKSVYPCFVGSYKTQKLTVPLLTLVKEVNIKEGSEVRKGTILFQLDTSLLDLKLRQKIIQRNIVHQEMQLLLLDEKNRFKSEGKEIEVRQVDDEINFYKQQLRLAQESAVAPFDGVITNLDYRLQEGFQPGEGMVVGELQSKKDYIVHALVPASDMHKIKPDQDVEIWLPVGLGLFLFNKIDSIKSYSETDLKNSPFSSRVGGEVATETHDERQQDVPLEALYDCAAVVQGSTELPLGMTGRLAAWSAPNSLAKRAMDAVARTFNRESIF